MKKQLLSLPFMKKRAFSIILALGMCLCLTVPAGANWDSGITGRDNTLVVSSRFVAFIDDNNTLWSWGSLDLLTGAPAEHPETPKKIMDDVRSVSVSNHNGDSVAVIKTDDSLWMWGDLSSGLIGNGKEYEPYEKQLTPVKIMDDVLAISLSDNHAAAIQKDHSLWTWGYNGSGQLGNGIYGDRDHEHLIQNVPGKVLDDVATVSCGEDYTAAVKLDGTLWMWGSNNANQFNNGGKGNEHIHYDFSSLVDLFGYDPGYKSDVYFQTVPIKVMDGVSAVLSSAETPLVLQTDGTLVTWPNPQEFSAQDRALYTILHPELSKDTPGPFPLQVIATDVAYMAQADNVSFIQTDGSLWNYGSNDSGQLGDGSTVSSAPYNRPVKVMDDVATVAVGPSNVAAVKTDGSLWMWGANHNNILRNGKQGNFFRRGYDSTGSFFEEICQNTPVRIADTTVKLPEEGGTPDRHVGFVDVSANAYYAEPVKWAVENGITSGTSDTTFGPNNTCTTAQILTFLWRAVGSPAPAGENPFGDVADDAYYADAAVWAYENGLVSGAAFGGNAPCTRSATVTYLWKLAGSPAAEPVDFTDVAADADYAQAVAWAVQEGITAGTGDATFGPDSTCTRGQIVTFLFRDLAQ